MDLQILLLLGQDGVTNGAIYALLALALVLVFAVTRIIFIPQGEFVAFGALTLAMLVDGKVPGTAYLLVDVQTEAAIIELLRALRSEGHIILVSTHNLGSVPEFCDQVVLIHRTVLAAGPLEEVFTEENLNRAFGGVLRQFHFEDSTIQDHDGKTVKLLTDDERPLVFGKGGHLEYKDRQGREQLVAKREKMETEDAP